jgi:hypothetical protein
VGLCFAIWEALVCAGVGVPHGSVPVCKDGDRETARCLNLDFELVKFDQSGSPIYVYYDGGDDGERIPLYCDEGKNGDLNDVCSAIRKMMFVLSFHPRHSTLKPLRNELMRLS